MSYGLPIPLPTMSLASAVVGTQGAIMLGTLGISASPRFQNQPGTLRLYNESGCGLQLSFKDRGGQTKFVRAGASPDIPIFPGESEIDYTVIYVIGNAPVSLLLAEYYPPTIDVPPPDQIGNSPVGGNIVALSATALNLISSDNAESVYLDDTSFAGVNVLVPSQYPTPTGARDIGLAARTGAASAILALVTNGASNIIQAKSKLQMPTGTLVIGGMQIFSGTGTTTVTHGFGVVPQIVIPAITNALDDISVGAYTTTQFTVTTGLGTTQWKCLCIV